MIVNKFTEKPEHNIYYFEVKYTKNNMDIKLKGILNNLNFMESHDIPYDIKFDADFKIYFIYYYPKNKSDENLLNIEHFNWYLWTNTVDRFRVMLVNNDFDEMTNKEEIEMILNTNKFNI